MRLSILASSKRGGTTLLVALSLPVLLGMAAVAVDLGATAMDTRRLQGIADAAAMAAAADPANAQTNAQAAVDAANWPRALTVTVTSGGYTADTSIAPSQRFVAGAASGDAVQVTLATTSPTYFARAFGWGSVSISRSAIAAQQRQAAFSIGSRLASVNGGVLNGLLSALTGSSVSLNVADYNALAGADIDLFGYLDALHTGASITAANYGQVLSAQVTSAQALNAAATQASDPAAAAALRTLASAAGNRQMNLASLIDVGPYAGKASGPAALAKVNAMALATAILEIASPSRQISFDAAAGVPGITATHITLAIGQRPAQSPWITVTASGSPIIRTAQARLYVETTLTSAALPGLVGLVAIKLPAYVELASAEGQLSAIDCGSTATQAVTINARPNPGEAAIAALDTSKLGDFSTAMALSPATLVDTPLAKVYGNATINVGAAQQWQSLRFTKSDIDAGTIKTVDSGAPVQGVAASLVGSTQLTVSVIGLPIPLTPLTTAVGSALQGVAPSLDTLLNTATGALGVHYGQADVRVTGMRCGSAALVG